MLAAGTTFQRYRIEKLIGSGGMGEVYRAYDPSLQRHIALKVLRADYAIRDGVLRAEVVGRAVREAQSAAAFRHPNAIAIYDIGEVDGAPFLAMELIEGRSLRAALNEGEVSLGRKLGWLVQIARALDAAHRVGLVHRDVKPDNVMVCSDGTIKVLDFGIAKRVTMTPTGDTRDAANAFETVDGGLVGTPRYMAPEQFMGEPVDARADQYAWGIVAYECLAGVHPASTVREPLPLAHLMEAYKPISEAAPGLPPEVAAVITRALSPRPAERFTSLGAAADALEPFVTATPHLPNAARSAPTPPAPDDVSTAVERPRAPRGMQVAAVLGALGLFLLGGGVVLIGLRRDRPDPKTLTLDAAAPVVMLAATSASAPASVIASSAPSFAAPTPSASALASASAVTASTPAGLTGCRCYSEGQHAYDYTLCALGSEKGPHKCKCDGENGASLCPSVPRDGYCASTDYTAPPGRGNGDACVGHLQSPDPTLAGQHDGKLVDCVCPNMDTFRGVQGGPCTGVDRTGVTKQGVLDCAWGSTVHIRHPQN